MSAKETKCDGNHAAPRCVDPQCWHAVTKSAAGVLMCPSGRCHPIDLAVVLERMTELAFTTPTGQGGGVLDRVLGIEPDWLAADSSFVREAWRLFLEAQNTTERIALRGGRRDLTIRELQTQLPWTVHYHKDFRSSPMAHKDFGHALLHVAKAAGKLAAVVNRAEHSGSEFEPEAVDRYVADLVVCALRMANTCPGRTIDLQRAVEDRIEAKNDAELRRVTQ